MADNSFAVIFLDRNGFLLYSQGLHSVLQFNFAPTVIRDLEIINNELLNTQIAGLFTQSGLKPFQGVILLADSLLFEKQSSSGQESEEEHKIFVDNLPFEHVSSIVFGPEQLFVATNKDLYQGLCSAFMDQKATITAVVPAFSLNISPENMLALNDQTAGELFRRTLASSQNNFLKESPLAHSIQPVEKDTSQKSSPETPTQIVTDTQKPDRKRLFILVGVFVFLLAILGFAALTML